MRKLGVFKIRQRVSTVIRSIRRRKNQNPYRRVRSGRSSTVAKMCSWVKKITKPLGWRKQSQKLVADERERCEAVPKGHLAVYVGEKNVDGDLRRRVLVPLVSFNHPLFGDLLRAAEEEYGFHHAGGISIPCRISEFERVKTAIAAHGRPRRKSPFSLWR